MSDQRAVVRKRLPKEQRRQQLLDIARALIHAEGTEQLTLGKLAEQANVSKPVVYDHFGNKSGVLADLYRSFETRQHKTLTHALASAKEDLTSTAEVIARAHIECCIAEGRELADVISALTGTPELEHIRQEGEDAYSTACFQALSAFSPTLDSVDMRAIIGAGDALGRAAVTQQVDPEQARRTLARIIVATANPQSHGKEDL